MPLSILIEFYVKDVRSNIVILTIVILVKNINLFIKLLIYNHNILNNYSLILQHASSMFQENDVGYMISLLTSSKHEHFESLISPLIKPLLRALYLPCSSSGKYMKSFLGRLNLKFSIDNMFFLMVMAGASFH